MPKFHISKSVSIAASVQDCYREIIDFKKWKPWSPWFIAEPETQIEYAEDGKAYSWEGKITGKGGMKVLDVKENERIDYELTFLEPYKSTSSVSFEFEPQGVNTQVTWNMDGSLPFFMFFMKAAMEAWIGMDYERGLRMLKDVVEKGEPQSHMNFVGESEYAGCRYLGIQRNTDIEKIGEEMKIDFEALKAYISEKALTISESPVSIYNKWDMVKGSCDYIAAFPLEDIPEELPEGMISGEIPACKVYLIEHIGPYEHLGNAWSAGMMRQQKKIFKSNKKIMPFERYDNDIQDIASEKDLKASVMFPLK